MALERAATSLAAIAKLAASRGKDGERLKAAQEFARDESSLAFDVKERVYTSQYSSLNAYKAAQAAIADNQPEATAIMAAWEKRDRELREEYLQDEPLRALGRTSMAMLDICRLSHGSKTQQLEDVRIIALHEYKAAQAAIAKARGLEDETQAAGDTEELVHVPGNATYRNVHGHSVVLKSRRQKVGWKVEFEWKDARGKTEGKLAPSHMALVYGLMITTRLAGYEAIVWGGHKFKSYEVTSDCPDPQTAVVHSMLAAPFASLGGTSLKTLEGLAMDTVRCVPRSRWLANVRSQFPWARTGLEAYENSQQEGQANA